MLKPVYFFYGDEPYKIDDALSQIKLKLFGKKSAKKTLLEEGLAIDRLEGSRVTGYDVLEKLQSFGLFDSAARLVIVRQAGSLKETDGLLKALTEADKNKVAPWGENVLVLVAATLDSRKKLHQYFKKSAVATEFAPVREAEAVQWAQTMAKRRHIKLSREAIDLLCLVSEGSLYRLETEIEKAQIYAGEGVEEITGEHVEAVVSHTASYEMAELVRAVLEGKKTRALLLVEQVVKSSEDALGFVGFVTWCLKNPERFQINRPLSLAKSRRLVESLLELDVRLKSAGMDSGVLVESFVIEQSL